MQNTDNLQSQQDKIIIVQGDITKIQSDAIVNAANTSLLGGGGVDGAIHRAAGPELSFACRMLHGCRTGEAKITPGFRLPAKWILHAVGPVWRGGDRNEDELLAGCYRACFSLAAQHNISTLAFPAISTGIYGFPLERATRIALRETHTALQTSSGIVQVIFVCFNVETLNAYNRVYVEHSTNANGDASSDTNHA